MTDRDAEEIMRRVARREDLTLSPPNGILLLGQEALKYFSEGYYEQRDDDGGPDRERD